MAIPVFGSSLKRVEDPHLITGKGRYVDDFNPEGCLHATFLRSQLAHGRIKGLNLQAAKSAPGIISVWVADDLDGIEPLEIEASVDGMALPERRVLSRGTVRHFGEAIAMVVAETVEAAKDALELIEVDIEPLAAVVGVEQALREDAPVLYPEIGSNIAFRRQLRRGAVKRAFDSADIVVHERLLNQRLVPAPLETRGALAWMEQGRLMVRLSTQSAYSVRDSIAAGLGVEEDEVRVIVEDVGGGFGSKGGMLGEELAVAAAARRLKRPVKWIEERSENFAVTYHGRGQVQDVELAAKRDGTVMAMRSTIHADMGGHLEPFSAFVPTFTPELQTGCYKIPASQSTVLGVYTNEAPTGPYRGAGRPEAIFMIERMMDRLAAEINMDPAEIRLRNFVDREEFPFKNAAGLNYDSGDYAGVLKKLLEMADYRSLRAEQKAARQQGRLPGIGLACYVEIAAGTEADEATVRLEADGTITVITGSTPHGQGHQTTWAQIAAERFGIPIERVRVIFGDTDQPAYAIGTFGSRSAAVSGATVYEMSAKLHEQLRSLAASAFEAGAADVVLEDGRVQVRGVPSRAMTLEQLASWAVEAGREKELGSTGEFAPPENVYPFGAHLVHVEVDRETGSVQVLRYLAVDDCGRVINPMIVDGQIHGAIAQGLAQALYEGVEYDGGGNLLTGNFTTYLLPTAADLPRFETERTETPSPHNPMGVKGIGEGGTICSTPAVANAVIDALRPLGVLNLDMPLTPSRIWEAISKA
jgi:carbon-monoxide dehydrogenase large subunit